MARVAGQVKSGFWWVFGFLCAFFFGGASAFADRAFPKYGVPADPTTPPTPVKPKPVKPALQKPPTEEEKKQAEDLVAKFLAPVEATEPSAEQSADVERLLGEMRRAGEAASFDEAKIKQAAAGLVRIGTGALGALKKESLDSDSRIAGYCRDAIPQIERSVRDQTVAELMKKPAAANLAAQKRLADLRAAADAARRAGEDAKTAGDEAAATKAASDLSAANDAIALLTPLAARITAAISNQSVRPRPSPVAKYGVKPRPRPEAKYGLPRPMPPPMDAARYGVPSRVLD